jgi:DNA invertase Pin-like site-specific DNA recombinase
VRVTGADPRPEPSGGRTYSYVRVSTTEQAIDRSSLADQKRRCAGAAMMRGEEIAEVFCDPGVSGSIDLRERPAGAQLLAVLQPGDVVIAAKMDRMFRSAQDALATAEALQARGVALIIADMGSEPVTGTGAAKLFFTMLAAFAEFERSRIAERMSDGRNGKRARKGFIGGQAPYGYTVEGSGRDAMLVLHPDEQRVIQSVKDMTARGVSLRGVSMSLTRRGMMGRTGRPFSAEQISRMLAR